MPLLPLSRREWLARTGMGVGSLALAALLADERRLYAADETPLDSAKLKGKAKSLILLFMGGGPSQVDTFDPKPLLTKLDGKAVPESIAKDIPKIARAPLTGLFGSPYKFAKYGKCGIEVSELFPHVGDDRRHLRVRSCKHDSPIHAPAEYIATTGTQIGDRPRSARGCTTGLARRRRTCRAMWCSSRGDGPRRRVVERFLPAKHQGTVCGAGGVPNVAPPKGISVKARQAQLELLGELNRLHVDRHSDKSDLESRIANFELAYRMQTAAPEAFDITRESTRTMQGYGIDRKETAEFGTHCLIARRLVERGVRVVQLRHGGWDAHADLRKNHAPQAKQTDKPIAGLLADLKRKGLLDSTLVVWGGEFGRTPAAENPGSPSPGRNHSPSGYSVWLAGGGVKGGQVVGATDEVGYAAVGKPVSPNNLHATILHAFGINQRDLVFTHNNRKEMVTVNGGEVVRDVFG